MRRKRGFVIITDDRHFLLAVIKDFEKEHPSELFKPLRIAVGAGVLAHNVLDRLDDVGNVGHGLSSFAIEFAFEFLNCSAIIILAAENINDFDRRPKAGKGINFENFKRFYALETAVGILLQQCLKNGPHRLPVFRKHISLSNCGSSFTAGQWRLIKRNMTNEVKCIEVPPNLLCQFVKEYSAARQFFDYHLLAFCIGPNSKEVVKGCEGFEEGLARIVL